MKITNHKQAAAMLAKYRDDADTQGAAVAAAPSGALPPPTAHCYNHATHDRVCFSCQAAAQEQMEELRRDALGTHPGTHPDPDRTPNGTRPAPSPRTRPESENPRSEHNGRVREIKVRPNSHAAILGRTRTHPGTHPDESDSHQTGPRYSDIAAMLAGTLPEPPTPTVCPRDDEVGLFYSGQYNVVFGDPEGGKTLLTDYATVCELASGGRVLRVDMDHNGAQSTISRLLDMGADTSTLGDPSRFLYIEPEDRMELIEVVEHMRQEWAPTLVVLDSIGELMPMFGHSSNSADDFTVCHSAVIKPLVRAGACVIGIDHLSKGSDSRAYGAGGTMAKKRALGGTSIRVTVDAAFTPGKGGSAYLAINKDRHGGLRAKSPVGDKEPSAGKFVLWPNDDGTVRATVKAPSADERNPAEAAPAEDIAAVAALQPPPTSANEAQTRLKWRAARARAAYKAWRLAPEVESPR